MESRLANSSVDRYVITPTQCTSIFTRHIFPLSRMYACTVTRIVVKSVVTRYGKMHIDSVATSASVRGVCVESILAVCTIRLHQCSNVWKMRTFESPNRCATIRTEPPLTLSVGLTHNFRWTVTRSTG